MSEKTGASAAENAAGASSSTSAGSNAANAGSSTTAPKGAAAEGNPAFRMMGLPRIRLPSRNWLIFLSITGSFASAVIYDKYQTRRIREKWCNLVSHIADENISTKTMPRKLTVYLGAPPADGLRNAREHFHLYMKPVLVAAAMDWDVVEGRKEGDVRFKTAERARKKRKMGGEGEQQEEDAMSVEAMRQRSGTKDWDGVAGDLVVGRHTWKEYVRGLHEGWLGPVDAPKQPEAEQSSFGDAAAKAATNQVIPSNTSGSSQSAENGQFDDKPVDDASTTPEGSSSEQKPESDEKKAEEEKPKPRHPPPYIQPSEYPSATPSRQTPEVIGPSVGIRFPHILGFRNTPIRIYRFLNRRHLADSIGRDVAAAVLASYRPYSTASSSDSEESSSESELKKMLQHEEKDWWKTTYQPRKEHEESVWVEEMTLDERITNRMRAFQLTAEDEDRAKRIFEGKEKVVTKDDAEG